MPTFGRIALGGNEIAHILNNEADKIQISLWDRIRDIFRPETKRETIEKLVNLMQDPHRGLDQSVQPFLRNFEVLASLAKPEELHQFSLTIEPSPSNPNLAKLHFRVAGHPIAGPELPASAASHTDAHGHPEIDPPRELSYDQGDFSARIKPRIDSQGNLEIRAAGHFDDLAAHAALYALRGEAANPKSTHELGKWVKHEEITALIERSAENIGGTRHRYGELRRDLERKVAAAGALGAPPTEAARQEHPTPSINPFEDTRSTNPFEDMPSTNPFENTRSTNPFEDAPSTNPFEEGAPPASGPFADAPENEPLLSGPKGEGLVFVRPAEPIGFIPSSGYSAVPVESSHEPPSYSSTASPYEVLKAIDDQLEKVAGPRVVVRDLEPSQIASSKLTSLIDRDADFSGINVKELLSRGADFHGVTLGMLQAAHLSVEGADLAALKAGGAWVGDDTSIAELINLGIKGGGTPVFRESEESQGQTDIPISASPQSPPLSLNAVINAGFAIEGVPLKQLGRRFDLQDCTFGQLLRARVNFVGADLQLLRELQVGLRGVSAASLLAIEIPLARQAGPGRARATITTQELDEMGISLRDAKATQLFASGLKMDGCSLDTLLKAEVDLENLELATFLAGGGTCAGMTFQRLKDERVNLTGLSFENLSSVSMQGVTATELLGLVKVSGIGVQKLIDAQVDAGKVSLSTLLGHEVSFSGADMRQVRDWNPDMNMRGTFVHSLLEPPEQAANLSGTAVKWLKAGGASFDGVTYSQLREAKCDFSGLTATDLTELSKVKGFFQDVSAADLLAAPDLDVSGVRLDDLVRAGMKLGNISTGELLKKGIQLGGAGGGVQDTSVKMLLGNSVSFAGADMKTLLGQNTNLNGTFVKTLLDQEAEFDGASVTQLKHSGASFAGVTYAMLKKAGCDFSNITTQDLMELGGNAGFYQGTAVSDLLDTRKGDFKGAFVNTLLRGGANFQGASIKSLKNSNASFAGVTYAELRKAGCDFSEATAEDLMDLGKDKRFYQDTPLSDLLNAPDVNLEGIRLADLPGAQKLAGVSIAAALHKGVVLSGSKLDALLAAKADLHGSHIVDLQNAELAFSNVLVQTLIGSGVSFSNVAITQLKPEIRFNGYFGLNAMEAGLRLTSPEDFKEFEARGGQVLERQSGPQRGNKRRT